MGPDYDDVKVENSFIFLVLLFSFYLQPSPPPPPPPPGLLTTTAAAPPHPNKVEKSFITENFHLLRAQLWPCPSDMNNDDDDLAAAVAALKNIPLRCRLFFISFVCMKSEDKMKSQERERRRGWICCPLIKHPIHWNFLSFFLRRALCDYYCSSTSWHGKQQSRPPLPLVVCIPFPPAPR